VYKRFNELDMNYND